MWSACHPSRNTNTTREYWLEKTFNGYIREAKIRLEKLKTVPVLGAVVVAGTKKTIDLEELASLKNHFIEDGDSNALTKGEVRDMGKISVTYFEIYGNWCRWDKKRVVKEFKLLPQVYQDVYLNAMETQFEVLRYCSDRWKAKRIGSSWYHNWWDARFGKRKERSVAKSKLKEDPNAAEGSAKALVANRSQTPPLSHPPVAKTPPKKGGRNAAKRSPEQQASTPARPSNGPKKKRPGPSSNENASGSARLNNSEVSCIYGCFFRI